MSAPVSLPEKVSVKNLKFFYGANLALKDISLPLYDKKVTAFIGPSGCGKSTLLRVLNRMYDLYPRQRAEGSVMLDGEDILADGQDVKPVEIDEFRIGVGETYDVIVEPKDDRAYTIEAQSIDRRGFARGTLAPREGMTGPAPVPRPPALLGEADMGHGGMPGMDHSKMDHAKMGHAASASSDLSGLVHVPPVDAPAGSRVLSYADLRRADRSYRLRPPDRTIDIRLTGNMEKFFWSFDDRKYSEDPVMNFTQGETVRLVFRNETMMNHPIHLHGLWMDLENGAGEERPRKHVVIVPPGRTVSVTVRMTEAGRWPFHCHFLYHMMTGMFREFVVAPSAVPVVDDVGPADEPVARPSRPAARPATPAPAPAPAPATGGGHGQHHH